MEHIDFMRQAKSLALEEGVVMAHRLADSSPETVGQKVVAFYRRMDEKMSASQVAIACKEGCDFCCYYHVLVTPAEALTLAEYIDGLPSQAGAALRHKVEETARRVAPLSQSEYIRTNIPCAFLDAGRCSVYSMRPTACRGFHSRDVDVCKRAFEDPQNVELNQFDPARESVKIGYRNGVLLAQHKAGFDATSYEMHGAVAEALNNRAATKRWKSGKISFPTVKDRTSLKDMTGQ